MTAQSQRQGRAGGVVRRVVFTVLAAGTLGVLLALPLEEQRRVSVEAWVIIVSVLLVLALMARMLEAAPVQAAPLEPIVRRTGHSDGTYGRLPQSLVPIQGRLLSAAENQRAFTHRLRPGLIQLVDHYLQTDHGVAGVHDLDQVRVVLGPFSWLVDPAINDRTPTLEEIEDLLNRLLSVRIATEGIMTE